MIPNQGIWRIFWGRDNKLFGHPARLDDVLSSPPFLFSAKFQFSYLRYDYFNFIPIRPEPISIVQLNLCLILIELLNLHVFLL